MSETTDKVVGCVVGVIMLPFTIIVRGICLSFMWGWFMEVQFELPHISTAHAIGISCLYGMFTAKKRTKQTTDIEPDPAEFPSEMGTSLIVYGLALFIAYIVHLCM